jgi:hypothetical protein
MPSDNTMPYCSSNKAPRFDQQQLSEFPQYFEDLDVHFTNSKITNDKVKKSYAKRYLDIEAEEVWTRLTKNADGHSYNAFKIAVLKLYPGADNEHHRSVTGMDNLINWSHSSRHLQQELGDYYQLFFIITEYLKVKGRISEMEANCNFVKGFGKDLYRAALATEEHQPFPGWPLECHRSLWHGTFCSSWHTTQSWLQNFNSQTWTTNHFANSQGGGLSITSTAIFTADHSGNRED